MNWATHKIQSHPYLTKLYAAFSLFTLVFQLWVRSHQCAGVQDCGLSFIKAIFWSAIWPISWVVYVSGYLLVASDTQLSTGNNSTEESNTRPSVGIDGVQENNTHVVISGTSKTISTTLMDITEYSYDLKSIEQDFFRGGAVSAASNDIFIASRSGSFYRVEVGKEKISVRSLPIKLDLHEDGMLRVAKEIAAGRWALPPETYLRVLDILVSADSLIASYTAWHPERKCVTLSVSETEVPDNWETARSKWRTIFESNPCIEIDWGLKGNQAGGRIAEVRPRTILLTSGDFEFDGVNRKPAVSQDAQSDYGKVLEIDLNTRAKTVFSLGLRNPQGLTIDRTGRIFLTEHGPRGGDELNILRRGADYGWPAATLGVDYRGGRWPLSPEKGRHDGFEPPIFAWLPDIGVGNLIEISGFAEEWDGDLLVCSLATGHLRRLRLNGDHVIYDEVIDNTPDRLRDIAKTADGRIVILTDSSRLLILTPSTRWEAPRHN